MYILQPLVWQNYHQASLDCSFEGTGNQACIAEVRRCDSSPRPLAEPLAAANRAPRRSSVVPAMASHCVCVTNNPGPA